MAGSNLERSKEELRRKVEASLAQRPAAPPVSETAPHRLMHELLVHQVELEMQNEQLKEASLALEESRDRYADLYDFAPVGYVTLTADEQIAEINLTGATLLGVARQQLLNKRFSAFVLLEDRDAWSRHFTNVNNHVGRDTVELALQRGDGTLFHAQLDCAHQNVGAGGTAIRIAISDISERKWVEAELERHRHHLKEEVALRTHELAEARDAANAANRAKSAFLARMSHELRTPLNGILGYAQILLRKPAQDERLHRGLNVIRQSGEQLLTLINDILDLAKIESGKVTVNPATVDLRGFLRTIADIVAVRAQDKGLAFVCDAAPDLPAIVCVDERILRQALLNLLSNAIKFTDRGSVALRARPTSDGGVRFAVEDTGVGISPEHLEKIFQPFEQVGDVRSQSGGTGLGLSIGREFVRLLGGEIDVESRSGAGTCFCFELKLPVVAACEATSDGTDIVTGYTGPRKKILIADDVAENRAVLEAALEPLGFELAFAVDGEEAVGKTLERCPDLILMDSVMPGSDGLAATRRLRGTPGFAALPIVVVSASATTSDHEKALCAGAQAFLPKPVDLDLLLEQIAALLHLALIREHTNGVSCAAAAVASFVVPPASIMVELHELALQGDMRGIAAKAGELKAFDAIYGPFAERLRELAAGFQSQAIQRLIEQLMK